MRVGTIAYATEQGLGRLAKDFYDHGVITDVAIVKHGRYPIQRDWYPEGTPVLESRVFANHPAVLALLARVDAMLFFETPFDWNILTVCRQRNIKTVIVPMYEWTLEKCPLQPDKWICPSKLDCRYFPGSPYLPVPVNQANWKLRTHANRFLHNAGHIGHRNHKGTLELLKALRHAESSFSLTVRSQDQAGLKKLIDEAGVGGDGRLTVTGEVPYGELFSDAFDAYVAPEKFNGLSLPLQEARGAGMLVMTTDRFPVNDWLPREPLIPVAGYSKQRVAPGYNWIDEAEVTPEAIAKTLDAWHGRNIEAYSFSGKRWAENHSWPVLRNPWLEEIAE